MDLSVNHLSSFCRKTTLTKHFRRWHTDEETSSEDGSDVGHEDSPDDVTMTRQSSNYYGDLWPQPFHATLVSRPKSTGSVKAERSVSVGPRSDPIRPHATIGGAFPYGGTGTGVTPDQVSVPTTVPATFHHVPVSQQYTAENGVGTWAPSMNPKASPAGFAEYSPESPSVQSNVMYFTEPTTSNYPLQVVDISLQEPPAYPSDRTAAAMQTSPGSLGNGGADASVSRHHYNSCPPEQPLPFTSAPLPIPQPPAMHAAFSPSYVILDQAPQFYSSAPEWLLNIKPEESWLGPTPSERMNDFYWS